MAQTPLAKRIWYLHPYVLSADMLSDEPTHNGDLSSLRADASCGGTCYVRVLRAFGDGTYQARVAATPGFNPHRKATPWCSPKRSCPKHGPGISVYGLPNPICTVGARLPVGFLQA